MDIQKRKKPSKIEKNFFSHENFELLNSVIPENARRSLGPDFAPILEAEMQTAFRKTNNPRGLSKAERKNYVQELNKAVLANVMKVIRSTRDITTLPRNGMPNTGRPFNPIHQGMEPQPAISSGNNQHQFGWGMTNGEGPAPLSSFNPPKREISIPHRLTREDLMPGKPDLHPRHNFQNFPQPPASTRDRGLEMRMKEPTQDALARVEDERAQMFRREEPKMMDFALPKAKEIDDVNPEDRLKQVLMERKKDDHYIASSNPPATGRNDQFPQERYDSNDLNQTFINNRSNVELIQERYDSNNIDKQDFHPVFSRDSIVDGLQEEILSAPNVIDRPRENSISETFEETKDIYLTINSRYRDLSLYPSPYHFSLSCGRTESDASEVIFNDEVIFTRNEISHPEELQEEDLQNIMVAECLDLSVPRSLKDALDEPYLWLVIDEWGKLNRGTNIPKNAFARLKPMPSNDGSAFITMRAHMLERHILPPNTDNRSLTLRLLRSDGEELEYNNIQKLVNNEVRDDEWVYVYSYYPPRDNMVNFSKNIFIYAVKYKKGELSFKMYLDSSETMNTNNKNKIKNFKNEKGKHRLPISRYLNNGDLFFLELPSKTNENKYIYSHIIKIIDDTVTIKMDHNPREIYRIGFLKRYAHGIHSDDREDINYKNGHRYHKIKDMVSNIDPNDYFLIKRCDQVSCLFRLLKKI